MALALAAVAAACAFGGWTWRLDRGVYDQALSAWSRPAPADVLIIAIDDASVEAIGRWPWTRAVHATLLQRLAEARPRAIGMDLLLSEPAADPRQDLLLAQALARAAPVVLPVAWRRDDLRQPSPLLPVAPLLATVRLGAVDPAVDLDGILRHGFLWSGGPAQRWPHLALALLEAGGERPHARLDAAFDPDDGPSSGWRRDGRFAIRFAGPAGSFPSVSYVDVLRGAVPAERLRGRYLLIGATAQGLGDRQATPVDGGLPAMPGVEVLANQLSSLRGPQQLREAGPALTAGLSMLLLVLLVAGMTRAGPRRALALALGAVPLAILGSAVLLDAGLWLPPMPFAIAALLAYPAWAWRRLERAMAGIDREIAALAEGGPPLPRGDAIAGRLQVLRDAAGVVRQARRFLADALEAQPTAMLVADAGHRVLLANARAAALFEVEEAADLVGLDLVRLLQELGTPRPCDWPQRLAAPAAGGFATEASLGETQHLMVHVAALDAPDGRRTVVTLADIASVRQAQIEREEALAFVSHDLRAPAGAIVVLADLNLDGAVDMPRERLLREVRQLAARTLSLADAFVRASRAGTQQLQREPVALAALVDEALLEHRPGALARGVALEVEVDDAVVHVDRFLLARALGNLVSNAVRHSPPGRPVRVTARAGEGRLRLGVHDLGPGLGAPQLAQLAAGEGGAGAGAASGVGLGLAFVQVVARRHGGSLQVRSPGPGGTRLDIDCAAAAS
ncbi:hypothetical protein ISF6_2392 [Piscinibacter sakaiensis]|uniref:histidine kinase n=1 Tax=Piscinibacter sakaiensis TaxID=1547922 RepID=A0A0K8P1L1_PISS1|nr:hypothetical protein ISF6_2392 [Piscinibacter sakaiensis]